MPSYSAFDYTLDSDVLLPELPLADGIEDVRIEVGTVAEQQGATREKRSVVRCYHTEAESYFDHPAIGRLLITDGDTITVDPLPESNAEMVRQFLMGPGFRALFHQRGFLVLHGSAVAMNGDAVAFVGRCNAGKSTVAAACYVEGHGIVTDDILVPQFEEDEVRIPPGFPRVKLDSATAEALDLPRAGDGESVNWRYYDAERAFPESSLSLSRIYLLEAGSEPRIDPVPPGERVHELLYETYTPYDENDVDTASNHFEQCATLSKRVPVRKLRRPRTFDELPHLVQMIEDDG